MSSLAQLRFFITPEHDCSYLENKMATTLFADPGVTINTRLYTRLTQAGFRRSGNHIYRPHCESCQACISTRIKARLFSPGRSHRRVLKKGQQVAWIKALPRVSEEAVQVYTRYINERHADGDMYPPSVAQFESFLVEGRPEAIFFEMRIEDKLMGVAVADRLEDGYSAIYTFFDPDYDAYSPGTLAILRLIEESRKEQLDHVYLGYWIRECAKMHYKIRFRPMELFIQDQWISTGSA
ncbi:MAG: arginyltransferase [Gammaproteobacteria bacterium]|nr:arginyltransferase [Gammaproteobacteria bacterium]